MNFFDPKHKKKLKAVWAVIAVLVIISMVVMFSGFVVGSGHGGF